VNFPEITAALAVPVAVRAALDDLKCNTVLPFEFTVPVAVSVSLIPKTRTCILPLQTPFFVSDVTVRTMTPTLPSLATGSYDICLGRRHFPTAAGGEISRGMLADPLIGGASSLVHRPGQSWHQREDLAFLLFAKDHVQHFSVENHVVELQVTPAR
jgi:hypothetical protein